MAFFGLFGTKQSFDPQPGDEVRIENTHSARKEVFVTELLDASKKELQLMIPMKGNELVSDFQQGMNVIVYCEQQNQTAKFNTNVLQVESEKRPPLLVLARPKKIEWGAAFGKGRENRNFVRLTEAIPVYFSTRGHMGEARTLDISGNGIGILLDNPIEVGTIIPLALRIGERQIKCTAKVVRYQAQKGSGVRTKYEIGLTFIAIDEKDQDFIVRHIFERQRELRRRGLL